MGGSDRLPPFVLYKLTVVLIAVLSVVIVVLVVFLIIVFLIIVVLVVVFVVFVIHFVYPPLLVYKYSLSFVRKTILIFERFY